ncbi:MAG: sulfatase [Candidatus Thorarchaeota archaeon]
MLLLITLGFAVGCRAADRPNILFVLTEDQGAHLSCLGTPGLTTPHLDSLAREGVLFRRAFVTYPVCSPSKAALYTGLHANTNGVRFNTVNYFKPASELTEQQLQNPKYRRMRIYDRYPTLIEKLRTAGYYTGVTYRLHVAPNHKFPFDQWIRRPSRASSLAFIRKARQQGKPWFLMYNMRHAHRPYRNSDTTAIGVDPAKVDPPDYLPDTAVVRKDWAEYLDNVQLADGLLGEALSALKESGEEAKTLVIFTSDHGPAFHRAKKALYAAGLHVPLAIKGPGIREGLIRDELVSQLDLMPTILDMLGIKRPSIEHGISIRSLLQDPAGGKGHDYVVAFQHHHLWRSEEGMKEWTLYDGRYRLIYRENLNQVRELSDDLMLWKRWRNRSYGETIAQHEKFPLQYKLLLQIDSARIASKLPRFELYDTTTDPAEIKNVAYDPPFADTVKRLRQALYDWAQRTKDPYISLEEERP